MHSTQQCRNALDHSLFKLTSGRTALNLRVHMSRLYRAQSRWLIGVETVGSAGALEC